MYWLGWFKDHQQAASPLQDCLFLKLLFAALGLRFLVALGLWFTVAYAGSQEPIIVLAERLRAIDAMTYHREAMAILEYWNQGGHGLSTYVFSTFLAWLYRLVAANPLTMSAFATICYLGVGLFAYGLAANLNHPRGRARTVSLIICLWPSSLAWSSLPLKDPLVMLAVFSFLFILTRLGQTNWKKIATWVLMLIGLAASVVTLVFLRSYLLYLAAAVVFMPLVGRFLAANQDQPKPWPGLLAATAAATLIMVVAAPLKEVKYIEYAPQNQSLPIVKNKPAPEPAPKVEHNPIPNRSEKSWTAKVFHQLQKTRRQFARQGGSSLSPEARLGEKHVALWGQFDTWQESLATIALLLKAAARDLLLFPYPWQRWPSGPLRPANLFVALQSLLWYFILPGLIAGIFISLRNQPGTALTIITWGLGLGLILGLAVLNRGTLFRLREMALMPLILVWHPWPYEKLWSWIKPGSQR